MYKKSLLKVNEVFFWQENRQSSLVLHYVRYMRSMSRPLKMKGLIWLHKVWVIKNRTGSKICYYWKIHSSYPVKQIFYQNYSAANFCFNKSLCMIWNEGTLSKHKYSSKSFHGPGFESPNRYESDLSNEVLFTFVGQEAAKISEVKSGGW